MSWRRWTGFSERPGPNRAKADVLVVSDTSVLLNLCRVSAEGLLPELFRGVWIPAVRPVLARLREEAGFWLHPGFEAEVLRLAGEA